MKKSLIDGRVINGGKIRFDVLCPQFYHNSGIHIEDVYLNDWNVTFFPNYIRDKHVSRMEHLSIRPKLP